MDAKKVQEEGFRSFSLKLLEYANISSRFFQYRGNVEEYTDTKEKAQKYENNIVAEKTNKVGEWENSEDSNQEKH